MAVLEYSVPFPVLKGLAFVALSRGVKQWKGQDEAYYKKCVARGEIREFRIFDAPDSYSVLLLGTNAQLKPQYEKAYRKKDEILNRLGKGIVWGGLNRIRRGLSREVLDYVKNKGISFEFKEDTE